MGSQGLWKHVEGTMIAPKPHTQVNQIHILADGKTLATEEQMEVREMWIINSDKWANFAPHTLLSITLTCLQGMIKDLMSAKDMWDAVKVDATTKSTLYLLNVENQLVSMKLSYNDDPKTVKT